LGYHDVSCGIRLETTATPVPHGGRQSGDDRRLKADLPVYLIHQTGLRLYAVLSEHTLQRGSAEEPKNLF
jgi:hypothetical protein